LGEKEAFAKEARLLAPPNLKLLTEAEATSAPIGEVPLLGRYSEKWNANQMENWGSSEVV